MISDSESGALISRLRHAMAGFSMEARVLAIMVTGIVCGGLGTFYLVEFSQSWPLFLAGMLAAIGAAYVITRQVSRDLRRGLHAIDHGLLNLKDSDFSATLMSSNIAELDSIIQHYNQLVHQLRRDRQTIYQRELLLDTVLENVPMSVLITDQNDRLIYSNRDAETRLNQGRPVIGLPLQTVFKSMPALYDAIESRQSGIFRLSETDEAFYHLTCGQFSLNARNHNLILIREMTQEMNRQEAAAWKNAIRVISHELNNSLAPITSLAHSGQLMLAQGKHDELPDVFSVLGERADHLKQFIGRYTTIAKLPLPIRETINWQAFYRNLAAICKFQLIGELPEIPGWFDSGQMHQVLLNLIKNAEESGSPVSAITLSIHQSAAGCQLQVADRGSGMTAEILQNALLPFYSTKPSGSGVGLSLCREIIEAHQGSITLSNRAGGGLRVTVLLPFDHRRLPLPAT